MKGSKVANIKLNPTTQKIVECEKCGVSLVVGKFSKNNQTCESAGHFPSNSKCKSNSKPKNKSAREKISNTKKQDEVRKLDSPKKEFGSFGKHFVSIAAQLDFEPDEKRRFRKRYAIDGGGIAIVYPHVEPGMAGRGPKLEYFSLIIQRVVGVNEDFRNFMPPDAASDCELLASELGEKVIARPDVGTAVCDACGTITSEFGVDPKNDKVLCVRPNGCFKKAFTNAGAEAEV